MHTLLSHDIIKRMTRRIGIPLFFFGISLLFLHPINSGDFFHHLNTGRHILNNLSLPYHDTLSFTAYGVPWVAYAWGSGVIFYIVYSIAGPIGIGILFACFGLISAVVLYLILAKLNVDLKLNLALVFLASSLISLRWPTRPEVLGPLFIIALVYLAIIYKKRFISIVFPLFFLLWGIIYGSSAFLGIAIFGFYIIVSREFNRRSISIFTACLIASLLNGYGLQSFLYIFQISKIAPHVGEWLPLHLTMNKDIPELVLFYQYTVLFYALFVLMYMLLIIIALIKKRSLLTLNLFFFCLSLSIFAPFYTNRFINLAPLLVAPFMALIINGIGKRTQLAILTMLLVLAVGASIVRFNNFGLFGELETSIFPKQATNFLKTNNIDGNIFSSQEIGAFISWERPNSKIFVDTRDDLYQPLGIFEELRMLSEGKIAILDLFGKYNVNIVIGDIANGQVYKSLFYNENWALVFLTDGYFISVKKDLADKSSLKILEALDPLKIPPVKAGELEKAERELRIILGKDPNSIENKIRMIEINLAKKEFEDAVTLLEELNLEGKYGARQAVMDMESAILLGKVYLAAHRCKEAYEHLIKAEKLSYGKLIFYPKTRLPTTVDRYLGEYYNSCDNNEVKAKEYFYKYLQETSNPLDRRQIEQKLKLMDN